LKKDPRKIFLSRSNFYSLRHARNCVVEYVGKYRKVPRRKLKAVMQERVLHVGWG
jgi:hypothetical protein